MNDSVDSALPPVEDTNSFNCICREEESDKMIACDHPDYATPGEWYHSELNQMYF